MQLPVSLSLLFLLAPLAGAASDEPVGKLLATDGSSGDALGTVAAAGSTAVAGAVNEDENAKDAGAAYLFDLATRQQLWKLLPSDGAAADHFGISVAIDDARVAVGASFHDASGSNSGAVYVFDTGSGQELWNLSAADAAEGDGFGSSVGLAGNLVLVGAPGDDDAVQGGGSVYAFDATTGQELAEWRPASPTAFDGFGRSLAVEGTLMVVGAEGDDDTAPNAGAVYLFDVSTGQEVGKLVAPDGDTDDDFGRAVAVDGGLTLVGSPHHGPFNAVPGAAYLFDTGTGQQLAKLMPGGLANDDVFGIAVALEGDRALVGTANDDDAGINAGAVYVFDVADPTKPVLLRKLLPGPSSSNDLFAYAVALEGDSVLVGASGDDEQAADAGAVYVYDLGSVGTSYCGPAVPNSSGQPGALSAFGSDVAAANCVTLVGRNLPANQVAMFLTSMTQGFGTPPGSQGNLCLGGGIGRYKQDLVSTGPAGTAALELDLTRTPTPGGLVAVQAGETWNFQLWFRDQNPGATSNLTDAVSVFFQ